MSLLLRVLLSRARRQSGLIGLRLVGLLLAALVAASVPAFVDASMQQVLVKAAAAREEPLSVAVSWTAPDDADYTAARADLEQYLRDVIPGAELISLPSSGQRAVQQYQPDGRLRAARRYLSLGAMPQAQGLILSAGRLPAPGDPEVILSDDAALKAGYVVGDRLRIPLTDDAAGDSVQVELVGSFRVPETGPLSALQGTLLGTLLTSSEYFASLKATIGEQVWVANLPADQLHTSDLPDLGAALQELPIQLARTLSGADLVETPLPWVASFLSQMAAVQRLLVVLLTPIFLLILFFALATANALIGGRRVEIAVLRSRGLTPLGIVGFYLSESLLLIALGAGAALLLLRPAVQLMGLSAGFLQIVIRPLLPVALTAEVLSYALGAAAITELIALFPLIQATQQTVATIRQEMLTRNPVLLTIRVMAELGVVAVVLYMSWRLVNSPIADDPLYLALPAMALAAAGVVIWRALLLLIGLIWRTAKSVMPPSLYLSLGLLRTQSARYQALWLMLVVTAGLGLYGASFARTLDRDLLSVVQYRLGSDLTLHPAWETEVLSLDTEGNPDEVAYNEPPFGPFKELPGVTGVARVQTRNEITLLAGTRNLGKVELTAIDPREFGLTARFLEELTPASPAAYLEAMAQDEQAVLVSTGTAARHSLKPGDRLTLRQEGADLPVTVAAIIPQIPGRISTGDDLFLVANLHYVQDALGLQPYDIWLRLEPGASTQAIIDELQQRQVRLTGLEDRRSQVAAGRREPFRLALYATLSAGFAIALLVMLLTYLLHVGLSLQSRAKELGVLRAMGMKARQVALSLYSEQLLLVGTAAATGLGAGSIAAWLYVPLLRRQSGEALLPLRVAPVDNEQLYLIIGFGLALLMGVLVVGLWLRGLAINKALRLGEDG